MWLLVCMVIPVQSSSDGGIENVFSILNSSFEETQQCALEDYIESSIQLDYSHH